MRNKNVIIEAMASSKLPAVHLTAAAEKPSSPLDSMFWGECYLPQGEQIPQTPDGEPMRLLAQLNFAQIPVLPGFPSQGLLQFWLDDNADHFEAKIDDYQTMRELYAIRFYPQPDLALQQKEAPPQGPGLLPLMNLPQLAGKMAFQAAEEIATIDLSAGNGNFTDYGYAEAAKALTPKILRKSGFNLELEDVTDEFCWQFGNWGCKLGGHPALRQGDIRYNMPELQPYTTLLFQYDLTTPEELETDTFVFLIKPQDLAVCRFDDVRLYYHNCF